MQSWFLSPTGNRNCAHHFPESNFLQLILCTILYVYCRIGGRWIHGNEFSEASCIWNDWQLLNHCYLLLITSLKICHYEVNNVTYERDLCKIIYLEKKKGIIILLWYKQLCFLLSFILKFILCIVTITFWELEDDNTLSNFYIFIRDI